MILKERHRTLLPCPVRSLGKEYEVALPPYVTLAWWSPYLQDWCEMQVHPDRADWFRERQEKIEGEGVIWQDIVDKGNFTE